MLLWKLILVVSQLQNTSIMSIESYQPNEQFYELDSSVRGYLDFWCYHGPDGLPAPTLTQEETPEPLTHTLMITHNTPDKRGYSWFIHW